MYLHYVLMSCFDVSWIDRSIEVLPFEGRHFVQKTRETSAVMDRPKQIKEI